MTRQYEQMIRRRTDATADLDFYRQNGLMERRVVMADAFVVLGKIARPAAAAVLALLVAVTYLTPQRDGAHRGTAAASVEMLPVR